LLPIIRIISGRGPIQPSPECWTISAELRILAEESVAGMDRVGAADLRRGEDGGNVEVALFDGGGPMQIDWSAKRTCSELASAVEWTATVSTPNSRAARMTRSAILRGWR